MEYTSVKNPVWADADKTVVTVDVVFPHLGDGPVKFGASPHDTMPHGREIYEDIIAGEYGEIAEYQAGAAV